MILLLYFIGNLVLNWQTKVHFENLMPFFRFKVYTARTSSMQANSYPSSGTNWYLFEFVDYDSLYMYLYASSGCCICGHIICTSFPAGYFSILACQCCICSYRSCFTNCFEKGRTRLECIELQLAIYNAVCWLLLSFLVYIRLLKLFIGMNHRAWKA